jgi:hypothetical protein
MSVELDRISIFPVPTDVQQSRISLWIRPASPESAGQDWCPVPVVMADSITPHPHANGGCEGWASICSDGPVELQVSFESPIESLRIRPSLLDPVPFEIEGATVRFRLDRPRYVVVESGPVRGHDSPGTPRYTLYLFLDQQDAHPPDPASPAVKALQPGRHAPEAFDPGSAEVLYLHPGVHEVHGQLIHLQKGKTLYLAGGAYLRSYVRAESAHGAAIRGPGVIDGTGVACKSREWRDDGDAAFVFFRRGRGITIDGPVIYNSPFWNIVTFGTAGTIIRNHKAITWRVNNDGVQPRSCNDMLVEHCFLKCADDCIAIKTRRAAGMTSRNLVFRDLVCWNDNPGNGVEIGHTSQADLLEQVRFEDIHVVHCDGSNSFAISISLIDHCTVRDVVYRNFYVEGVRTGDFRFWIGTSRYTTDEARGHIRDVTIDGYFMEGPPTSSTFTGADSVHMVSSVKLGQLIRDARTPQQRPCVSLDELNASFEHATNILLRPPAS